MAANEFYTKYVFDNKEAISASKEYVEQLKEIKKSEEALNTKGKGGLQKHLTDTNKAIDSQVDSLAKNITEQSKFQKQTDKTEKSQKKAAKTTEQQLKGFEGFKGVFSSLFPQYDRFIGYLDGHIEKSNKIKGSEKGVNGTFASIRSGLLSTTKAALGFIATPIGAAIAALAGIGIATKKWIEYNNTVIEVNKSIAAITNQSGEVVDQIRLRATSLNDVFDVSIEETTKTAQKLVAQFKIDYLEAFDVIEEGLIRGADANDEYFDSLREYGTFFADAGFSVREFQSIINTGFDLGIYSDKLPDAIKEFKLSIEEQTKGAKDALIGAFGEKFTTRLLNGVNSGLISTKEALELVSQESENLNLSFSQNATLTADIFRGAGEDVGGALKVFQAVNVAINEQGKELSELEIINKRNIEATKAYKTAQDEAFKSDSFIQFKTSFEIGLKSIGTQVLNRITAIRENFQELFRVFSILKENVSAAFKPFNDLIQKFKELEIVQKLSNKIFGEGETAFSQLKKAIEFVAVPTNVLIYGIKTLAAVLNGAISTVREFGSVFREFFEPIKDFDFSAPFESLSKISFDPIKNVGARSAEAFSNGFNEVFEVDIESKVLEETDKAKEAASALFEKALKIPTTSLENLNRKLAILQEALKSSNGDSTVFNKIKTEIEATQKAIEQASKSSNKQIEKTKDIFEEIEETTAKLEKKFQKQLFTGDFLGAATTLASLNKINSSLTEFLFILEQLKKARKDFDEGFLDNNFGEIFDIEGFNKRIQDQIKKDGPQVIPITPELTGVDKFKKELADLLGISTEQLDAIIDSASELYSIAVDLANELYEARLQILDSELEAIGERKAAIQDSLDEEFEEYQKGYANSYEAKKQQLDELNRLEEQALKEKEDFEKKAAKRKFIAETAAQALNLATASTEFISAMAFLGPAGFVIAGTLITAMFAMFARTKLKAYQAVNLSEGDHLGRHMSDHDERLGNSRSSGIVSKTGGSSDKNKQKGHRIEGTNIRVGGNEYVLKDDVTRHHLPFIDKLNAGKYWGLDLESLVERPQFEPKDYLNTFNDVRIIEIKNNSLSKTQLQEVIYSAVEMIISDRDKRTKKETKYPNDKTTVKGNTTRRRL